MAADDPPEQPEVEPGSAGPAVEPGSAGFPRPSTSRASTVPVEEIDSDDGRVHEVRF